MTIGSTVSEIGVDETPGWQFTGWYLAMSAPLHLSWEFAQMPLYEVWYTGSPLEIAYNGLHCTVGDLMIAAVSLLLAVILIRYGRWLPRRWPAVLLTTVTLGFGYTIFSEWHNVFVLRSWAYANLMPILPGTGIGLSPLIQWLLIPPLGFWLAGRQQQVASKSGTNL